MNSPSAGAQHHHQRQEPKMLLRKRPRPPPNIRRTTSMRGITLAVEADYKEPASDVPHQPLLQLDHPPHPHDMPMDPPPSKVVAHARIITEHDDDDDDDDERFVMSPSSFSSSSTTTTTTTTTNADSSPHVMPTPHFLRTCGLCKRGLAPGRDIYMYRGDTAFCSLECRKKQMRQDEKREKWKVASNKDVHSASSPPTAPSDDPTNTKTIVAAST